MCGSHSPLQLSLVHIPAPSLASCKYLYLDQNILSKYKTTTTNPGVIVWGPSHPKGRILGVGTVTHRFNELAASGGECFMGNPHQAQRSNSTHTYCNINKSRIQIPLLLPSSTLRLELSSTLHTPALLPGRQGKTLHPFGGGNSQVRKAKGVPETRALVLRSCSSSGTVCPVS